MGGGSWDTGFYASASATRAATGKKDFAYTATATTVHPSLNPIRIKDKIHAVLESRDSDDHPNTLPVLMCFDVTGSNRDRAVVAQKRLPTLMDLLGKYVPDVHVAVAANDDYATSDKSCIQISEFEADNRLDDHIRNIWLIGAGGGNQGESYDLLLYAAARKVKSDSMEKRNKKGYLFLYADERIFDYVDKIQVMDVFGDTIEKNIPIAEMIEEVRKSWNIFILSPDRDYQGSKEQYKNLFGEESVIESQDPNLICELVASIVGLYEKKTDAHSLVTDLVKVGASSFDANSVSTSLSRLTGKRPTSGIVPPSGGQAARL